MPLNQGKGPFVVGDLSPYLPFVVGDLSPHLPI
jgi:hypothetical protein